MPCFICGSDRPNVFFKDCHLDDPLGQVEFEACESCLTEQGWDVTGKQSSVTSVFMLFKLAIDRRKWESVHVDDMYVDGAQNCPKCGSDLLSVAVSGIVGCEECYQAYRPFIKEMLLSRRDDEIQNSKEDIAQLLNEAIEAEDFEKAAVLRDLLASGEKK